jgi:hypothetical protein
MDRGIRYFSLLRLRDSWKEWAIGGGLKYGALKGLEKWGASAGADLTGLATFEGVTGGLGSLVILGATALDAPCYMPAPSVP